MAAEETVRHGRGSTTGLLHFLIHYSKFTILFLLFTPRAIPVHIGMFVAAMAHRIRRGCHGPTSWPVCFQW